jgi:hypothetical protein
MRCISPPRSCSPARTWCSPPGDRRLHAAARTTGLPLLPETLPEKHSEVAARPVVETTGPASVASSLSYATRSGSQAT